MVDQQPAAGRRPGLLRLERISKRFGGVQALKDISFDVAAGEVLCLAGENGCGKSTLIKIISGVHAPEPGAVMEFDGKPMEHLTPARARELGIQVIWQDLALFPEMSVAENIAFERNLGPKPHLVDYGEMKRVARSMLDKLGVSIDPDRPVRTLSIAQRQLVAIARALVADARLVFMDEPTASLSHAETLALLEIVRRLSSENIAVVFVSHRLAEVLDVCERVTVLRDGRYVGTFPTQGMTQIRLTELMTGKEFNERIRAGQSASSEPVLSVRSLTRRGEYRDISFDIRKGEIVGLTGRLGAGRTELALSIFGMSRSGLGGDPPEGQAAPNAVEPRRHSGGDRLRVRGPAVARPGAAAVNRRQHGRHGSGRPDEQRWIVVVLEGGESRRPLDQTPLGEDRSSRRSGVDPLRAATSSASSLPSGWPPSRRYSSWTLPPSALMSARAMGSSRSSASLQTRAWRSS